MSTLMKSILIDSREAARLCGIGRTAWLSHMSTGKTPAPIRLGRRVLWVREEIIAWCKAGCPPREKWVSVKWDVDFRST